MSQHRGALSLARMRTGRHDGCTIEGNDMIGWKAVCDCFRSFPAERHPVERDHFEHPQWEQHVKKMRAEATP